MTYTDGRYYSFSGFCQCRHTAAKMYKLHLVKNDWKEKQREAKRQEERRGKERGGEGGGEERILK